MEKYRGPIYNAVWDTFSDEVRSFIDNKYLYWRFWKHHNGLRGYGNWEKTFNTENEDVHFTLSVQNNGLDLNLMRKMQEALIVIFSRLYVLRNQLIHGGATYESSVNRKQVRDGAEILAFLMPLFIELMMDNPDEDWGKPFYPPVYESDK